MTERHPAGVGLWRITLKDCPSEEILERGHTAYEAFTRASARLGEHGFSACLFELVADVAPGEEAA